MIIKKWIDFVEIKFHSHDNTEWCRMQLEFKFYWIEQELNSNPIEEEWKQSGTKGIENLLVTTVLIKKKKTLWKDKTSILKDTFPSLFTWKLVKHIPI